MVCQFCVLFAQESRMNKLLTGIVLLCFSALVMAAEQSAFDLLLDRLIHLEARVLELEGQISAQSNNQSSTSRVVGISRDKAFWRDNVKQGMTKNEIRDVLGEPTLINVSNMLEYWSYALNPSSHYDKPSIRFNDGRVAGFQEPD